MGYPETDFEAAEYRPQQRDQRGATRDECTPNLWHQQVWDEAREETAWSENKEVRLRDCSKRTASCSY